MVQQTKDRYSKHSTWDLFGNSLSSLVGKTTNTVWEQLFHDHLREYYQRGQYIPGIKINGMDVLAVAQASRFAREHAISEKGPVVMEFVTYRYGTTPYKRDINGRWSFDV